jgi:hypothetical protein
MVYFHTKNPNLDKFCIALEWKMLVYDYMVIWNILRPFGTFYGGNVVVILVYFPTIWYIVSIKIWQP